MALKLYNTLTRKKELFRSLEQGKVRMYSCGPTVYNYPHIGNYRAYACSDLLRRYLTYSGYAVMQVMNLTDVDDKTIRDSQKEGVKLDDFTARYKAAFFEDLAALNIRRADVYPEATKHIPQMVALIRRLLEKGIAYKAEDGIYYNIHKFPSYGCLAHINIDELEAGASGRVKKDEYDKENIHDFVLWKFWDEADGGVSWETELGKGRPGWHIECSAMSSAYLGETFDIHTGGIDLVFPHHQNEIAQSEGASGKPFVKYWVHNEWLRVDGKKMSKSLGNFYTLRDLLEKGYSPLAIRYLLLSSHYRQQLNFTFEGLDAAKNAVERLNNFIFHLSERKGKDNAGVAALIAKAKAGFEKQMDNDLAIAEALAVLFEFVTGANKLDLSRDDAEAIKEFLKEVNTVLGVMSFAERGSLDEDIQALVDERERSRKAKDWTRADEIRDMLTGKGIILEDTKDGVVWKKG